VLPFQGALERGALRRRATEVKKPPCPWCGGKTSSVYRSKGVLTKDGYRRRRQCADCGRDWPTVEELDRALFARELAAQGLALADVGLETDNLEGGRGEQPWRTQI
jgi:hypothetical protein